MVTMGNKPVYRPGSTRLRTTQESTTLSRYSVATIGRLLNRHRDLWRPVTPRLDGGMIDDWQIRMLAMRVANYRASEIVPDEAGVVSQRLYRLRCGQYSSA
jgi:hypothetical protein